MIKALDPKPVYPVEDYEKDLAEIKLANSKPRPKTSASWAAATVFLAVIFMVMLAGSIFGLRWAGWL
jgi:hypothetical protein